MKNQSSNPLYNQFLELVSVASTDVIKECIIPLSKTLLEAQQEISKIEQYAHDLSQQYVDIENVVTSTTNQVLDKTIEPVVESLSEVRPTLMQAATTIVGVQKAILELKTQSKLVIDKHQLLDQIALTVTQGTIKDTIQPIQQSLLETVTYLKESAETFLRVENCTQELIILAGQIKLTALQSSSQIEEINNTLIKLISDEGEQVRNILTLELEKHGIFINTLRYELMDSIKGIELKQSNRFMNLEGNIENLSKCIQNKVDISEKEILVEFDAKNKEIKKKVLINQCGIFAIILLLIFIIFFK